MHTIKINVKQIYEKTLGIDCQPQPCHMKTFSKKRLIGTYNGQNQQFEARMYNCKGFYVTQGGNRTQHCDGLNN